MISKNELWNGMGRCAQAFLANPRVNGHIEDIGGISARCAGVLVAAEESTRAGKNRNNTGIE